MKNEGIRKLAVLGSLALGGCTGVEGLERLVINKMISEPPPISAPSDYVALNPPNDLVKEQSENSDRLTEFTIIIPTESSDEYLTFKQELYLKISDQKYHKIRSEVADFLRNPNLDDLKETAGKTALGLGVGYIANLRPIIKSKKKIQRKIKRFISEGLEEIGIDDIDPKVSTKGLQFKSRNKTFTLGKTIKFEYRGLNNHFTGTCKVELPGVLDGEYLVECRLGLWW